MNADAKILRKKFNERGLNWFMLKSVWNVFRGSGRVLIRVVTETVHRLLINIVDTLFGFLNWPTKKLRIKVFILKDQEQAPVIFSADLEIAIEYAKRSFKNRFNVELVPYRNDFVGILQNDASPEILYTKGGVGALQQEFKIAGSLFAKHLCGPIYPVTTFVVMDISNAIGCSLGPLTDYITLDPKGVKSPSTLAHELAHACGLWHINQKENLLWRFNSRGDKINWWQKNIFRSSRHVTYW